MTDYNRNPTGRNQHTRTLEQEALIHEKLLKYHRQNNTLNTKIALQLAAETNIVLSESTIKRLRQRWGFTGGAVTERNMPKEQIDQLILDELDKDPAKRAGVGTIWARVSHNTGTHLRRDTVADVMHQHDLEGFAARDPTARKVVRRPIRPAGIHEWWSGDGHDKLKRIGFALWMMVDGPTTYVLDGWIVPNNRLNIVIAYLFLCLVEAYGGVPYHTNTDCGSETTLLYGIVNALRDMYHSELNDVGIAAHKYLRSIHNIQVERTWKFLRYDFGDNAVLVFEQGVAAGRYDATDPDQFELCQWLWSRFLQELFDDWRVFHNGKTIRRQDEKPGPSGQSREFSFLVPSSWNGLNYLQPIDDPEVITQLKEDLGGASLIAFNTDDYKARALAVYEWLGEPKLTLESVWDVFEAMLPSLRADE